MLRSRDSEEILRFIETAPRASEPHPQFGQTPDTSDMPPFPKAAWRGPFADYRDSMVEATEASDVFHFAALWACGAVALGRKLHFPYGFTIYPNVFLVGYGLTGDRKTSAMRKVEEIGGS